MKSLYFDYNATTPLASEVFQGMEPFLRSSYANPSSIHHLSKTPAKAIKEARKRLASFLNVANDRDIVFTSGGTESNNAAIRSCLAKIPQKKEIVTSEVEHSSILKICSQLEREGYCIKKIHVDSKGRLDLDELKNQISDQTALVTLMMANNETGVHFPIEEAGKIVKEKGVIFHVDAVQVAGKEEIDLKNSAIDFLSLSAHKFYGPKGVGILYVKDGTPFQPLIFGGSQERGRRAGTENVPGIVGMGRASQLVSEELTHEKGRLSNLQNEFESFLKANIPDIKINGEESERLPNTSNVQFSGVDGEALLFDLDQNGICASSGSACMSGAREPSHVLKAMGLTDDEANASIRFSFGRQTTSDEIKNAIPIVKESVMRLRNIELQEQHDMAHRQ